MLSRFWRPILFFTFVLAFLISAPLVVLYTAGYRYHPGSGKIVQTGIVSVSSLPKGATVWIDGQERKEHTPAVIDDVWPGAHLIRVEKPDYSSWQKTLDVVSRQSIFASNIVLFLTEPPTSQPAPKDFEQSLVHGQTGTVAFFKKITGGYEIWGKKIDNDLARIALISTTDPSRLKKGLWSQDGRYLFVADSIVDIQTRKIIRTLNNGTTMVFDARANERGYLLDDKKVSEVDFLTGATTPLPFSAMAIASNGNDRLLIQNTADRSILSTMNPDGIASILAYLPIGSYRFVPAPDPYLLVEDTLRGRVILIDPREKTEPILLNSDATEWTFDESTHGLLFTDGFAIERYDPSTHNRVTVTRLSQPIHDLHWYAQGKVVVFETGGNVYAQELDRRGEINKTTLVEGLRVADYWFEEDGAWIAGITKEGGGFRKRLQR